MPYDLADRKRLVGSMLSHHLQLPHLRKFQDAKALRKLLVIFDECAFGNQRARPLSQSVTRSCLLSGF